MTYSVFCAGGWSVVESVCGAIASANNAPVCIACLQKLLQFSFGTI